MNPHFESPADARSGDQFHIVENCAHADGEVIRVEVAPNATGKVGHVVIWKEIGDGVDKGRLWRTRWSAFKANARRSSPLPVAPGKAVPR